MKVTRATSINGPIILPGDKSISHRAAMIAAMARGETRIGNYAASYDCEYTLKCLKALGVGVIRDGAAVTIEGVGTAGFTRPVGPLDCGNSGTTMRLMAGILAGQDFKSVLTGDDSLISRPMSRVIKPLTEMGATIESRNGTAPISIAGRHRLQPIEHRLRLASAQVKSCILLAGLCADGETAVIEATETRDHTERMLRWFGVDIHASKTAQGTRIAVLGGQILTSRDVMVPSDMSSAAFFIVAAVCLEGSDITLPRVGMNPTRRPFVDILSGLGYDIEITEQSEVCNEPVATLRVRHGHGVGGDGPLVLHGSMIAGIIDEIPILAVLGTQLRSGIEVRDAGELRVKETDRIAAIITNLRAMGAQVTENDDGFKVERSVLEGAAIDSFGDHRIAMAFAIAGLLADGETTIADAACVDISFPGFFEMLRSVIR